MFRGYLASTLVLNRFGQKAGTSKRQVISIIGYGDRPTRPLGNFLSFFNNLKFLLDQNLIEFGKGEFLPSMRKRPKFTNNIIFLKKPTYH
jgi:hypothetical protein